MDILFLFLPTYYCPLCLGTRLRIALRGLLADTCKSIATSIIVMQCLYIVWKLTKLKHSAVIVSFNQSCSLFPVPAIHVEALSEAMFLTNLSRIMHYFLYLHCTVA